ncbi:MAG: penicillin-binding protein 2 [Saprospiraceae bacterium]|nr:penicillin-binding protein 2 [Saprospiraceae bacterium]
MSKFNTRQAPILWTFILGSLVLLYKLADIQLFDSTYKELAQKTILDKQTIYPARGLIYDRNGALLTYNKPIYDLEMIYRNIDPDMDTTLFCELLQIDRATFLKNVEKNWRDKRYHKSLPTTFLSKISPEVYARFQEQLFRFPGFYPVQRNIRAYPHTSAAHILGYLGEVDMSIINAPDQDYEIGDYIGKSGLEKKYEDLLRGKKGVKFLVRDNLGREVSSFNNGRLDSLALAGTDLISTLDLELQQYAESLMEGKRGSIVAIEPKTGEILTMLSAPGYDPNLLNLDRDRGAAFKELLNDSIHRPFLDRSISARYPPGSIFKPILSLISFEEEVFQPNKTVTCPGYYQYRTFKFGCHQHKTPYNIEIGLMHSCNSYFFSMFRALVEKDDYSKPEIGLDILKEHLYDFGLGRKLGIDLSFERDGYVPTPEYYDRLYRGQDGDWRSTYIMSIGIGQGELELTTLQMANLAAIIGNRGYYFPPHLIRGFSQDNRRIDNYYATPKTVRIEDKHFDPVINGMYRTITQGTGYRAYVRGLDICGKTGTSENPHGADHSVFFAFAPKDDPQIAIAVYVENAGFGGDIAAPIAGLVIEKYLTKETKRPLLEERIKTINLIDKTKL